MEPRRGGHGPRRRRVLARSPAGVRLASCQTVARRELVRGLCARRRHRPAKGPQHLRVCGHWRVVVRPTEPEHSSARSDMADGEKGHRLVLALPAARRGDHVVGRPGWRGGEVRPLGCQLVAPAFSGLRGFGGRGPRSLRGRRHLAQRVCIAGACRGDQARSLRQNPVGPWTGTTPY